MRYIPTRYIPTNVHWEDQPPAAPPPDPGTR